MGEREDRILGEKGLAFFGSVVAGQSHEITNVLNIIHELAGLQEDLLSGEASALASKRERIGRIAARIRGQVERGETILRQLNRFAHTADRPRAACDLKELLERVVFLARRPATLRKVVLEERFPEASVSLETSPFLLEQAVFTAIETAIAAASRRRRVTVSYRLAGEGAAVDVQSADPIPPGPERKAREALLALLAHEVGGSLTIEAGEGPACLTLSLARRRTPPDAERARYE
jgi:C4-dicarboxylate-specific signal transduction histidine kinase